jgi:uncharacterized membrane protein YuzA (DUF378 family)
MQKGETKMIVTPFLYIIIGFSWCKCCAILQKKEERKSLKINDLRS